MFHVKQPLLFSHAEPGEHVVHHGIGDTLAGEGEQGIGCLFQEYGHGVQQFAGIQGIQGKLYLLSRPFQALFLPAFATMPSSGVTSAW